jgi:hypothetical protein
MTPKAETNAAKVNGAMNAAFAFWVAKTTMSSVDLPIFLAWAKDTAVLPIAGKYVNRGLISDLQEAFPGVPASFPDVVGKAQELSETTPQEWDPHHRTIQILDAISKAGA